MFISPAYSKKVVVSLFGLIFVFLFGLTTIVVQAQTTCFSDPWSGPPATPPNSNRTKPVYQLCTGVQYIDSNLDIDASDTSVPGVDVSYTGDLSQPALQVALTQAQVGTVPAVALFENTSGDAAFIEVRDTDVGDNPELRLQYGAASSEHWALYVDQSSDDLRIWSYDGSFANQANRMTITQDGYVGLGDDNDTPSGLLHLNTSAGASLADGILFGDADTGVYEVADDVLRFMAAGSESVRITAAGNVGIDDDNPVETLSVSDSSMLTGDETDLFSIGDDVNANRRAVFSYYQAGSDNNSALKIRGKANGGDHLVVEGGGDIGIGISNPVTKLDVAGAVRINDGTAQANYVLTASDANGLASWQDINSVPGSNYWTQAGSDLYPNNNSWRVGVGTASPNSNAKLHVEDTDGDWGAFVRQQGSSSGDVALLAYTGTSIPSTSIQATLMVMGGDYGIYQTSGSRNAFWSNTAFGASDPGSAEVYVNGQIGVGETSPGAPLHIKASSNNAIRLEEDGSGSEYFDIGIDNSGNLEFVRDDDTLVMTMEDGTGDVGIGVDNPSYALDVSGEGHSTGGWSVTSDLRFKKDIIPLHNVLGKIQSVDAVQYYLRTDEYPDKHFSDGQQIGFIAQEIVDVFPEVVQQDGEGYYSIDYGKLTPILWSALQEQQAQINSLEERLQQLEQLIQ